MAVSLCKLDLPLGSLAMIDMLKYQCPPPKITERLENEVGEIIDEFASSQQKKMSQKKAKRKKIRGIVRKDKGPPKPPSVKKKQRTIAKQQKAKKGKEDDVHGNVSMPCTSNILSGYLRSKRFTFDDTPQWMNPRITEALNNIWTPESTSESPIGSEEQHDEEVGVVPYVPPASSSSKALVVYEGHALAPSKGQGRRESKCFAEVDMDRRSIWLWSFFSKKESLPESGSLDDDTEKWWENERRVFRGRAELFLTRLRSVQGDRSFCKWKGSIVDSVVGVFLTQNVSDLLSSSSFISLVARFPLNSKANSTKSVFGLIADEAFDSKMSAENSLDDPSFWAHWLGLSSELDEGTFSQPLPFDETMKQVQDHEMMMMMLPPPPPPPSSAFFDVDDNLGMFSFSQLLQEVSMISPYASNSLSVIDDLSKIDAPTSETKARKTSSSNVDWDSLRREAFRHFPQGERSDDQMDSADWEAVRHANVNHIADAIRERGQHNILAGRIKNFLNRVAKDHGSVDLEWLRNVPPEKAKEYLLSIDGLGIKSTECVRLLALHFKAFPVDTNVARILVRLGWVPLQPLPESAQLHVLEQYPVMESVQKYLWPRLWTLDQPTLYELHYQLITFGKIFCTKRSPNCNGCPMRQDCKHYASACSSAKRLLPGPKEERSWGSSQTLTIFNSQDHSMSSNEAVYSSCEPIIEEPPSPEPEFQIRDIEDCVYDSEEDNVIRISTQECNTVVATNQELQDSSNPCMALIPCPFPFFKLPELKTVGRHRTKHHVYELPDDHPILESEGMEKRECYDQYKYLFAIWQPGENAKSTELPMTRCKFRDSDELCGNEACYRCNTKREAQSQTVRGTLLIPCRTAMRGRFPLNGTYFQVNEVFADHKSSKDPIVVPTKLLWNLPRKFCYFGTGVSVIFRGLSCSEIRMIQLRGVICIRGFDRETRKAKLLYERLHAAPSRMAKSKGNKEEDE